MMPWTDEVRAQKLLQHCVVDVKKKLQEEMKDNITSYEAMKRALRDIYDPPAGHWRAQLHGLRQAGNEAVEVYANRVSNCVHHIKATGDIVTDREQVQVFISVLLPYLRVNLRVNNAAFDTMAKAVARVREMSYALQAEGYSVAALNPAGLLIPKAPAPAVSVPPRVAAPVFPVGLEDLWAMLQAQQQSAPTQDTLKSLVAAIQQMSRSNNAPPPPAPVAEHKETQNAQQYQNQDQYQNRGPRRRPPPTATCHNCGIAGHMSRGCLLPRRPRGTHQQNQQQTQTPNAAPPAPPSRSAQQEGHSVNKLVGAIQASPSAPQRHVLTVPVQLFDKSFDVLLDTCSPVSIVSPAVAAQIAKWCPVEKADEIEDLLGAGGEQLGFKGKVIVPFQFINAKPEHLLPAKLTFFVVDRFPGDLLIGLSDLGSLGFEVSTVHWTAYFATLGVTLDVKQAKSAGFTVTVVSASDPPCDPNHWTKRQIYPMWAANVQYL